MLGREILAIGATGAVFIFFLILIAYAAYGVVICFAEDSTLNNFKNFSISNVVLICMGAVFFAIGLIALYFVFEAGGFIGCEKSQETNNGGYGSPPLNFSRHSTVEDSRLGSSRGGTDLGDGGGVSRRPSSTWRNSDI